MAGASSEKISFLLSVQGLLWWTAAGAKEKCILLRQECPIVRWSISPVFLLANTVTNGLPIENVLVMATALVILNIELVFGEVVN